MKAAVILGAGFSKNSGLPVQSEIPPLLMGENAEDEHEQEITRVLKDFFKNTFGYVGGPELPQMDDMLTCIDISTNSGHHLGISYSSRHLRAIRRFLVYRIFTILDKSFRFSNSVKGLIEAFHRKYTEISYVNLNWDTVLERYLLGLSPEIAIDYCNGGDGIRPRQGAENLKKIKVLKTHGSMNWLYCDNCRSIFNDFTNEIPLISRAGFQKDDFRLLMQSGAVKPLEDIPVYEPCSLCGNSISSHIATFSYRKSFRANSFSGIWGEAEETLSHSDHWIFIGYSLPEADYEFKHLLKIAELKLAHQKTYPDLFIDVILADSKVTTGKYKSFFGKKINRIYNGGIEEYLNNMNEMI